MSQQSQSGLSASFHRGYNGDPEGPQIYSVRNTLYRLQLPTEIYWTMRSLTRAIWK